jgi:O-antigen ligase
MHFLTAGSWSERVLWAAVAVLPFQQGLTLNVGFPLKATEILAAAGILLFVIERRRSLLRRHGPLRERPETVVVTALATVVLLSTVWALVTSPHTPASDAYPRGIVVDLLLYTSYAGLALGLCLTLAGALSWTAISAALGVAVRLAAVYCVVQFALWAIDVNWLEAVNGNVQLGSLYGVALPRNGPFLEGNYLGFFATTSLFVMARARDHVGVVVAAAMVAYSSSTSAIVALMAAVVVMVVLRPTLRRVLVLGAVAVVGVVFSLVVPPVSRFVLAQVTKLGLVENTLGDSYGYSLRTRTANAETGFSMALDHPLLGVGQGRYALHYWEYLDLTGLPPHFGQRAVRPIANNVYAQLAAETGFIALALLIALLGLLLIRAWFDTRATIGLVVVIAIGLIAFPAWTNLVAWTMIAACLVATRRQPAWKPLEASRRRADQTATTAGRGAPSAHKDDEAVG